MSTRNVRKSPVALQPRLPVRPVMVLVEDPVLRVAVSTLFRDHGFAVRELDSLPDAILRVEIEPPLAIVMDVARGWPAAHLAARTFRLLRITCETPLVAVTGAPAPAAQSRELDAVLTVPFTGRGLLETVRRLIERHERMGGAA